MADESQSWVQLASTMFEPAPQSIADTLLAKVFGNWVLGDAATRGADFGPTIYGNFIGLDEVTLISTLLGFSGILAAAFGLIIASYTFLMQMVKNSWQGSFSADGINSIFWPARAIAAFALIVPVVTIGDVDSGRTTQIATAQVFMMELARRGSAFGDTVSEAYVTNSFSYPMSNSRPPDTPEAVFNMLEVAICTVTAAAKEGSEKASFRQILNARTSTGVSTSHIVSSDSSVISKLRSDQGAAPKTFATHATYREAISAAFKTPNVTEITFSKNGMCGRINFRGNDSSRSNAKRQSNPNDVLRTVQDRVSRSYIPAYEQLAINVFTTVSNITDSGRAEEIIEIAAREDASASPEAKWVYDVVERFNTDLYTLVAAAVDESKQDLGGSLFEPIKRQGWAALGALYNVIPRVSNISLSNISDAHGLIEATASQFPCNEGWLLDDCEAREQIISLTSALTSLAKRYRASYNDINKPQISVLDFCTIDQCSINAVEASIARTFAHAILNGLVYGGEFMRTSKWRSSTGELNAGASPGDAGESLGDRDQKATQDPHPAITLSSIGASLNYLGAAMLGAQIYVSGLVNMAEAAGDTPGVGSFIGMGLAFIIAAANYLAALFLTLSNLFLSTGFVLSYVLPMIPFFIFSMQVIGWLATIGEAMFAVCFAVALLTNSDGDGAINTGFLKALSLTAAVFLKPFFIVIGVALSSAVAAPAFAFFSEQYWLAWDLENAIGNGLSSIVFQMSAQLILFVVVSGFLLKFIYSIQHIVPDSMNNWISGGIVNPFGVAGVADGLQGTVVGSASKVSDNAAASATAMGKNNAERKQGQQPTK